MTNNDNDDEYPIYGALKSEDIDPSLAELQQKLAQHERLSEEQEKRQNLRLEFSNWKTIVVITLFGIVMIYLGRVTTHWWDLTSEVRDIRERLSAIESKVDYMRQDRLRSTDRKPAPALVAPGGHDMPDTTIGP